MNVVERLALSVEVMTQAVHESQTVTKRMPGVDVRKGSAVLEMRERRTVEEKS
jgi:hypothetical protein